MRFKRTRAVLFGASLLTVACSTDNHGHPVTQPLYSPVFTNEAYLKNIIKISDSPKLELLGIEEGHFAAQFNQEGLELATRAPGKLQLKIFLTLLDEDGNEVPGAFFKQPLPEPVYVDRDVNKVDIPIADIVSSISKKVAKKVTENNDVDIFDWINDGSIRVNYEFNLAEKDVTAPSGERHYLDAPYFTGERIDLLNWPEPESIDTAEIETVTYTYHTVTTCSGSGKTRSCSSHLVSTPHYHDQAEAVLDIVAGDNFMERNTDNSPDYFKGAQVVEFALRDRNAETTTTSNGRLLVTTENATFEFYVDKAREGEVLAARIPNWASKVVRVEFNGFAPIDFGDRSENQDIQLLLGA